MLSERKTSPLLHHHNHLCISYPQTLPECLHHKVHVYLWNTQQHLSAAELQES